MGLVRLHQEGKEIRVFLSALFCLAQCSLMTHEKEKKEVVGNMFSVNHWVYWVCQYVDSVLMLLYVWPCLAVGRPWFMRTLRTFDANNPFRVQATSGLICLEMGLHTSSVPHACLMCSPIAQTRWCHIPLSFLLSLCTHIPAGQQKQHWVAR